jgi:hypothetical protein
MANNTTSNSTVTNITSFGTLPKDMLARYSLTGNVKNSERSVSFRNDKTVRRFTRMVSIYRVLVHKSKSISLPSPLKSTVHYFAVPMSRADSDNPRDRRGLEKVETQPEAST